MRIVLEGCDCTGKTVFSHKLVKAIDEIYGKKVTLEHEGLPPNVPNLFEHYAIKALAHDFCIHDRLHLGERTYGRIYRNNDQLGPIGQHIVDHIIASEGFGIICTRPWHEVEKTWLKRKHAEYVKDAEALRGIFNEYASLADHKHWLLIDPTRESDQQLIWKRLKHLRNNNKLIPFVWGIGPSTAETLVVGEMSNHPIYDLPFFSTKGSSAYLITTLMNLGIGHNYYLTNAIRKDGSPRIMGAIINDLPKLKRVFALGITATKELRRQNVPAISLPHPQFYNRFKHVEAAEYLKLFKLALEANHASQLQLL